MPGFGKAVCSTKGIEQLPGVQRALIDTHFTGLIWVKTHPKRQSFGLTKVKLMNVLFQVSMTC